MASAYPVALDTESSLYVAVNNFVTTLTSNVNNAQSTIPVSVITGLPTSGLISIDSEVIKYTGIQVSPPAFTGCTRGFDGTPAAAHASAARVEMRWAADHHNALTSAIVAIENELGITPRGTFASVAARIAASVPLQISVPADTDDWTFTHTRGRVVSVQLYRRIAPNTYELFTAPIQQVVNVTSTVTILLTEPVQGYIVYA